MEITRYKPGAANAALDRIRARARALNEEVLARVAEIVEAVRDGGDRALIRYTEQFDRVTLSPAELRVDPDALHAAARRADSNVVAAFRQAIANVRRFHERQRERDWRMALGDGAEAGQRILPVASAGLYVPGGRAAYPSSVVMNAVPAQVAGVRRIAVATPPGTLEQVPEVAAVLVELGLTEVYRVGGAQAIAALAYGTESIARVDKIVGPGNVYVAAAKRLVYGAAGIDAIAGPSEVVVLADQSADARFVAADLLSQAEHDEEASAICVTTSDDFAEAVAREVARQLDALERHDTARASVDRYGAIFVVDSLEDGCQLINELAPEHLELMTEENERAASLIENAGAIFFGEWSPEPVGDYFAGPNHVLPTVGTARFSSALGVYDFLKRQSIIRYSRAALERHGESIARLADAEGLTAHRRAVTLRLESHAAQHEERAAAQGPPLDRIKPAVRALNVYTLKPHKASVKINQNENPFDMPEEIKREVERRLRERQWTRYPEFDPSRFLERLAAFAGWRPDGVLAGNGSNELIQATLMVTVREGTRAVIAEPTFLLYRQVVALLDGEVISVPLTADLQFDMPAIERRAIEKRAGMVILCSPNNPTGCRAKEEDVRRLARSFGGLVVIDEAYHEFSGASLAPLLAELPNLVILRTFSKAMAMAGLRVGYLLGDPLLVREIHKATLPYNLNFYSATAAEVACERFDLLRPHIELLIAERERLRAALAELPNVETVPSEANFLLVRTPLPPRRVFEELLKRDILVRDVSGYPMLSEYVRISVGTPAENDRVIEALRELVS